MSCEHGNHEGDCDLCEAVDTAWKNGYASGVKSCQKPAVVVNSGADADAMNLQHGERYGVDWIYAEPAGSDDNG